MQELKEEFKNMKKLPLFEIEVINKEQETDYLVFDISIEDDTLKATHAALTKEDEDSPKIAFKSVDLDDCFSLDEHLQDLYSECTEAICNSDFFTLV